MALSLQNSPSALYHSLKNPSSSSSLLKRTQPICLVSLIGFDIVNFASFCCVALEFPIPLFMEMYNLLAGYALNGLPVNQYSHVASLGWSHGQLLCLVPTSHVMSPSFGHSNSTSCEAPWISHFVSLQEPIAFAGGIFAGLLRLDLNEDPLKEWVTRTADAAGITEEEINAQGSKTEEEVPEQIEIE
ncbi:hypothetical protein Pint_16603 [Pistacia integerrima]|uniref:Uncharacterized protein n=1 Tax=Pistacia integerrima TaxID=434235 RepID=A0ACC0ZB86_9ROSI|nr:hypothetical protein Pint_16603 [Pistacia integerrima]